MPHHFPTSQQSQATGLRRDVTWGRILFVPPELTNPRIVFDPLPFRSQFVAACANPEVALHALIPVAQVERGLWTRFRSA